jgi:hypothetical protein
MKFGIMDQNDRGGLPLAQQYRNRLELVELYDRSGLHCFHMSEHHSTSLSMAPSPSVFMAAVAPRQSLSRAIVQAPGFASRISASALHDAWIRSAALRDLVDRHNEALFGHAIQSVACNALHSVEARFCRWLLTCHDRISSNTVALTQEFLADMLGVQRTTVTAVARGLQDKGAIRYRRGVVDIIDRSVLEQLACECYGVIRNTYERLLPGG